MPPLTRNTRNTRNTRSTRSVSPVKKSNPSNPSKRRGKRASKEPFVRTILEEPEEWEASEEWKCQFTEPSKPSKLPETHGLSDEQERGLNLMVSALIIGVFLVWAGTTLNPFAVPSEPPIPPPPPPPPLLSYFSWVARVMNLNFGHRSE